MPILNHSDLKKVEEYQNFVRTSPYANATQDLAWEKVKEGWTGEQVYLEENGKIVAAMSLIYPQGAWKLFFDVCTSCSNLRLPRQRNGKASAGRSKPLAKKYHAFLLRFDPELPRLPELEEEYRQMGLRVRNDGAINSI